MLEVKNLSVNYGKHRALDGACVRVGRNEIVIILGANGAGKSSLMRAICGVCEGRVSGEIDMDSASICGWRPDRIVAAGIALVPEGRGVFADLTVRENLALGAHALQARDNEAANLQRVYELFPKLAERRKQVVRTMSGGEQQMVAIGRALMSNPKILALDEPSLGLSPLLCKELFQNLKAVRETGTSVLLVEQNAKQGLAIADRGYLLENGTIGREDSARALANDPAVQKAYLGAAGAAAPAAGGRLPPRKTESVLKRTSHSRPADNGVDPSDIAAAAIKSYSEKRPSRVQMGEAASRQQAYATNSGHPANGESHADFPVDRTGNGTTKAAAGSGGKMPENGTGKPVVEPASMPQLGNSDDRLRSMLAEIEEAAQRARNYQTPGRKR